MSSVLKFDTIELIKFSRIITARIDFQSEAFSPSSKQIDSRASLTIAGGFAMERTSTKCCFLIDLTAINRLYRSVRMLITRYYLVITQEVSIIKSVLGTHRECGERGPVRSGRRFYSSCELH